jgi:hypothetical protein
VSIDYGGDVTVNNVAFTITSAGSYQLQTSLYMVNCDTELYLMDSELGTMASNDDYIGLYVYCKIKLPNVAK